MLILSSLSTKHPNNSIQKECVQSWLKYGMVQCIQTEAEAAVLKKEYPAIKFIVTDRTTEGLINKKLISINAFLDVAKHKKEDLLIINSDIMLIDMPVLQQDGITLFQRMDYDTNIGEGSGFQNGWDAFYIPNKFLSIYPMSIYAMGACWWDYWIPYRAIRSEVPIHQISGVAYHKKHNFQWIQEEWNFFAKYFQNENGLPFGSNIGQMGTFVLQTIKKNLV